MYEQFPARPKKLLWLPMRCVIALLLAGCGAASTTDAVVSADPPTWLEGSWRAERDDGATEEVWARVDGHDKVFAISNEDLERSTDEKTSAVHFMRFEFSRDMINELLGGADLQFGSDHENYQHSVTAPEAVCQALAGDFT